MDLNLSALGHEALPALRQPKSINPSADDHNPALADFASILGGLVSPLPHAAAAISDAAGDGFVADEKTAFGTSTIGSETLTGASVGGAAEGFVIQPTGADAQRPLAAQMKNTQFLASVGTFSAGAFSVGTSQGSLIRNPATSSLLLAEQQLTSLHIVDQSASAAILIESDQALPINTRRQTAADTPSELPHNQAIEGRERDLGGTSGLRGVTTTSIPVQESTASADSLIPAAASAPANLRETQTDPSIVEQYPPHLAQSTMVHARDACNSIPYPLADIATKPSASETLAELVKSAGPSSTLRNVATPLVSSTGQSPASARGRLSIKADARFSVDVETSRTTASHEPAATSSVGELLGVAGRLKFNDEGLLAKSAVASNGQPMTAQGTLLQLPLHQELRLPPPQMISTPLSAPQWPSVFSTAIVRLVSEQISEANLTVTPEHLGTINISIALEGNRVSLGFTAADGEVRQAVNASLPMLNDMLEKSGLSLGQSSVGHEAQRDASPTPNRFRQSNNPLKESDAAPVIPLTPLIARRPQGPRLGAGRVDFFA